MMKPLKLRNMMLAGALFAPSLCVPQHSSALTFTYDLNTLVAGQPIPPTWTTPYARATFTDTAPGVVQLTMQALGINPWNEPPLHNYSVDEWFFNVPTDWTGTGPATDLGSLAFAFVSGSSTAPAAAQINRSLNNLAVTGDGNFDFGFQWLNPSGFDNGEQVVYNITYIGAKPFSAAVFDNLSAGDSPHFHTVMKVRNESPPQFLGDTTAVAIPGSLLLVGVGLIGWMGYGTLRRRDRP
jgi:hypothetical protein